MSNNPIVSKHFSVILLSNEQISTDEEKNFFDAVKNSLTKKVDLYLENGVNINLRDSEGKNALYWAMHNRNFNIIKKLIAKDISLQITPSLWAMNYAVYKNDVKLIKCLKNSGVNLNDYDDVNSTPLIYAVLYNKIQSINYLINNGASLVHEDSLGNSALSLAYDLKIQYLIKKFEAILKN